MTQPKRKTRLFLFLVLLGFVLTAFIIGRQRIKVDSDITSALPNEDPIIKSARLILDHHGALDNIFIDISLSENKPDKDSLILAAKEISIAINESGLARITPWSETARDIPRLHSIILNNLPILFSPEELAGPVSDRVKLDGIRSCLELEYRRLFELGSPGSIQTLSKDPFGLSSIVWDRIKRANPFPGAKMYRGRLFSQDFKRLLIIAEPTSASSDTNFGRDLNALIETAAQNLKRNVGTEIKIAYTGACRATWDNEKIIRQDTFRALVIVMVGLVILAFFCFQNPWRGVLTLFPAIGGLMLATFVYSFYKKTIFAVSLGFGGALISIAVDHALAFALLADSSRVTDSAKISREVWRVASFTVYTTIAALFSLAFTGIPLFEEVGVYAALGVGLAAVLVHVSFPCVFQEANKRQRQAILPLEAISDLIVKSTNKGVAIIAIVIVIILAFFIRLDFKTELSTLNTVSESTMADEKTVLRHWGGALRNTYVLAHGQTLDELWRNAEHLSDLLKSESGSNDAANDIMLTSILPGPETRRRNLQAWKRFWSEERVRNLVFELNQAAREIGFKPEAFEPFYKSMRNPDPPSIQLPRGLYRLFGISKDRQGNGLVLVSGIRQWDDYNAKGFFLRALSAGFPVYDATFFSTHLGEILQKTFVRMFLVLSLAAVVLLILLFMDWRLLIAALLPLLFSLTATLGTLGLFQLPMSLPSLMIAPLVFGLGMDYGLYLVRSRQRYGTFFHPNASAFRQTILLGGISTLIGAGSLLFSEHVVLRTVGLSAFLGITYAMIGAFTILPLFLDIIFKEKPMVTTDSENPVCSVNSLYRQLEPHPRFFARFKMAFDPMFPRLADFIKPYGLVLDIGCGYGTPSAWLSFLYPDLQFVCMDPDPERCRATARVLGEKAVVSQLAAPILPNGIQPIDTVLLLDVAHYLSDADLAIFLDRLKKGLAVDGKIVMRVTLPINGRMRWQRWLEIFKTKITGKAVFYRPENEIKAILHRAGFEIEILEQTAPGREETWFVAR